MLRPRIPLAAIVVAALLAGAVAPAHAQILSGRATVIDGATLDVRGTRIRLFAVDAPDDHVCEATDDNRWRCGPRAATALAELLEEAIVTCTLRERDLLGRAVATCSMGAVDLSLWLIRNGLAREATPSSNGKYRQAESEARAARRGIWSAGGAGPSR